MQPTCVWWNRTHCRRHKKTGEGKQMIPKISAEDLKKMQDREGLVLQGCGGDLQEWEDGIHQMLAEEKILQNGAHFKEIYAFEHEGCTNLLFMMDGIELDTGNSVVKS